MQQMPGMMPQQYRRRGLDPPNSGSDQHRFPPKDQWRTTANFQFCPIGAGSSRCADGYYDQRHRGNPKGYIKTGWRLTSHHAPALTSVDAYGGPSIPLPIADPNLSPNIILCICVRCFESPDATGGRDCSPLTARRASKRYSLKTVVTRDGKVSEITVLRPRTTIGFPITISADNRFKNAVAVVEVEVETNQKADFSPNGEAPVITAGRGRLTTWRPVTKNLSISGGMVYRWCFGVIFCLDGKHIYRSGPRYGALTLSVDHTNRYDPCKKDDQNSSRCVDFIWQFRPVLGAAYVKSGLKQTFVQLAFPSPATPSSFGTARVKTYWRKYKSEDRHSEKRLLRTLLIDNQSPNDISSFNMGQQPSPPLNATNLEDLRK